MIGRECGKSGRLKLNEGMRGRTWEKNCHGLIKLRQGERYANKEKLGRRGLVEEGPFKGVAPNRVVDSPE